MTSPAQQAVVDEWKAAVAATGQRRWPEWKGKTPDTPIPKPVRARIVMVWGAKCFITGKKCDPKDLDLDHVIALADKGQHREANLRPVYRPAHRKKTGKENSARAKAKRVAEKHLGLSKSKTPMHGRDFTPAPKQSKASKPVEKPAPKERKDVFEGLPRPSLFRKMTPDEIAAQKDQ